MSKRKRNQRWRISRIGGPRQQYVTTVLAPNEAAAIKTVIKEHDIKEPEQQRRLVAWPRTDIPRLLPHLQRRAMGLRG